MSFRVTLITHDFVLLNYYSSFVDKYINVYRRVNFNCLNYYLVNQVTADTQHVEIKFSPIYFYKKYYTLSRSPHLFNKSKEHFVYLMLSRQLFLRTSFFSLFFTYNFIYDAVLFLLYSNLMLSLRISILSQVRRSVFL